MHDAHGGVVRAGCEQREFPRMKGSASHCPVMILKRLIRLRCKIQVPPNNSSVIRASHDMITGGVNGNRRNPLGTRYELLQLGLPLQVIDAHAPHGCNQEMRLARVEGTALHLSAFEFGEWPH